MLVTDSEAATQGVLLGRDAVKRAHTHSPTVSVLHTDMLQSACYTPTCYSQRVSHLQSAWYAPSVSVVHTYSQRVTHLQSVCFTPTVSVLHTYSQRVTHLQSAWYTPPVSVYTCMYRQRVFSVRWTAIQPWCQVSELTIFQLICGYVSLL